MRKTLGLLVMVCFAGQLLGQKVRIGLTASPTFGFLRVLDESMTNQGSRAGLSYGLLIEYRIDNNENYAFSSGVLHSLTGGNVITDVGDSLGTMITQNLKPQYISLPATIRLRTNEIRYITYYGQFGLIPSFLISKRENRTFAPDPNSLSTTNSTITGAQIVNIALQIGAGIEYSLSGATALLLGVYYDNGFTNIIKVAGQDKISLRHLGIRAGMFF